MTSKQLITTLTEQVSEIIRITKESFLPLDDAQLNWKESPEQWSILECIEHLNRYSRYYQQEIMKQIIFVPQFLEPVEVRSSWIGKKFIKMMHPDTVKKQKTFARMNPANSSVLRDALQEFLKEQNGLLKLLSLARSINPNKGKVPVEFFKLITLNIGDAFQFVIVHEQRHINQAMNVLSKSNIKKPALII